MPPVDRYFGGHGDQVMKNMTDEYGAKKGKSVFYATANKRNQTAEQMGKHKGQMKAIRRLAGEEE